MKRTTVHLYGIVRKAQKWQKNPTMKLWVLHKPCLCDTVWCSFDVCLMLFCFYNNVDDDDDRYENDDDDTEKKIYLVAFVSLQFLFPIYYILLDISVFVLSPFFISAKLLYKNQHRYFMWCDYCCGILQFCARIYRVWVRARSFQSKALNLLPDIVWAIDGKRFCAQNRLRNMIYDPIEHCFLCFERITMRKRFRVNVCIVILFDLVALKYSRAHRDWYNELR